MNPPLPLQGRGTARRSCVVEGLSCDDAERGPSTTASGGGPPPFEIEGRI